jgi:hypothetical protein
VGRDGLRERRNPPTAAVEEIPGQSSHVFTVATACLRAE